MGKRIGVFMLLPNLSARIEPPFSRTDALCPLKTNHVFPQPLHQSYRRRLLRGGYHLSLSLMISLVLNPSVGLTADNAPDVLPANQKITSLLEFLDEETLDKFDLGELVAPPSHNFPNSSQIFVVTSKDIVDQNSRNVGEALRFVPGLIFSEGGTKNPKLASLRGLGTRQYVVFIDGRPVYDPYFGDVDLNNLPIDNVALIKVVKGPVEAAYGPNTFGGVINIVTKRGKGEPTTEINASYEAHNTQDYWIQHGGQHDKFNYYVTGSYRRSNGFPLSDDFSPALHEEGGSAEQSGFHKYNVAINLGYDKTPVDKIALVIGYYQAELDVPPNVFGGGTGRRRLRFTRFTDWERFNVDLYGQMKLWDQLTVKSNVYYDRFSDDLVIFDDSTYSTFNDKSAFRNTSIGGNLQATWEVVESLMLKAGTFIKQDKHEDEKLIAPFSTEDFDTLTLDYFLESDLALTQAVTLSGGINYDVIFTGGERAIESWNPRGALHIRLWPESLWHVSLGKKSRLPRLLNLFAGRGNLRLEAENNLVLEVGANQLLWNGRIEADLVWFRNDVDNMIVFRPAAGGGTQDQNAVSFVSHGIEAVLTANLSQELTVSIDYTYIDQVFENRGDDIFNDDYHQLNSQWQYQAKWGLGLSLQGSYVNFGTPSKPTISSTVGEDSFFLLNGKLSYSAWKGMTPYLAVENILDTNYSRVFGFPQPGRRLFFGISAKF